MPKDLGEENVVLRAEIENLRLKAEKARLERELAAADGGGGGGDDAPVGRRDRAGVMARRDDLMTIFAMLAGAGLALAALLLFGV